MSQQLLDQTLVMVTSTPAHCRWLERSLTSHLKIGSTVCLGWDYYNFTYPKKISDKVRVFCTQSFLGVQGGDAYQIQEGLTFAIYNNYKYFFKSAGDIVINKPEDFCKMHEELGDYDIMTKSIHEVDTKVFFGKVAPCYRIACACIVKRPICWIERQYLDELNEMNYKMKQHNFHQSVGMQHLQAGHTEGDWWWGLSLEDF